MMSIGYVCGPSSFGGMAWYGTVQYGTVWYGMAWICPV